jgi:hypothetical protein
MPQSRNGSNTAPLAASDAKVPAANLLQLALKISCISWIIDLLDLGMSQSQVFTYANCQHSEVPTSMLDVVVALKFELKFELMTDLLL